MPAIRSAAPTYWATITPKEEHAPQVLPDQELPLRERLGENDLERSGAGVFGQCPHGDSRHQEQEEPRHELEHRPDRGRAREVRLAEEQEVVDAEEDQEQDVPRWVVEQPAKFA
jgi:hypothetical protein